MQDYFTIVKTTFRFITIGSMYLCSAKVPWLRGMDYRAFLNRKETKYSKLNQVLASFVNSYRHTREKFL